MDVVRRWRRGFWAAVAVLMLAVGSLLPHASDSAELVRLRNALLLDAQPALADWTPERMPLDFARERHAPSPAFQARVDAMNLPALASDWERALAIARHLLAARHFSVGHPIQSDLERTYAVIRSTGQGYCGDYADVFAAMAIAAGLPVRSWAFSFDGFGGRGHVFNEIWDAQSGRWRMIDVFHNLYAANDDGTPVSALEFRAALLRDAGALRLVAIEPRAKPVFKYEDRARDFYRRGLGEWYLWWGNNVYTYDQAALVRTLGTVSRSLEQLGGIAQGVHPRIRVLAEVSNRPQVEAMQRLQRRLWITAALGIAAALAAMVCAWGWSASARRARP